MNGIAAMAPASRPDLSRPDPSRPDPSRPDPSRPGAPPSGAAAGKGAVGKGAAGGAAPALVGPPLGRDEIAPMPAEMTFGDFLTALNPLHHIPVVGWVYRQITGETIQPVFRAIGGLVMGGPIGAIAAAVGALAEELIGEADFGGGDAPATAVAATPNPAPNPAPVAAGVPGSPGAEGAVPLATASGRPLQPLPLATRLAARAYPAPPPLPLREAAPPPDPASGFVPAAAALAAPEPRREAEAAAPGAAPETVPAAAPGGTMGRIRRTPVVPITSGGQDPAFMQRMMQGLQAYDRAMRSRRQEAAPLQEGAAP